jgi:hypothetical protein
MAQEIEDAAAYYNMSLSSYVAMVASIGHGYYRSAMGHLLPEHEWPPKDEPGE